MHTIRCEMEFNGPKVHIAFWPMASIYHIHMAKLLIYMLLLVLGVQP